MQLPDRVTTGACIGCGAISRPGTCELGCGPEQRLDLVDAADHDELARALAALERDAEALGAVIRPLTGRPPADAEAAYRALQAAAREALRAHPAPPPLPAVARLFTTWWCPGCGGIDAPQPCIGVCVWRAVEWVPAERHEQLRLRAAAAARRERALRTLLRRCATVTPRAGQWERGWAALASVVHTDA